MFGLYRRCCSSKDNISVNCRDNGSNLNTFTNSSNISTISSSILYNRMYRSETGKIMNVLFLLFLVFGSCVVSFGMENSQQQGQETNPINLLEKDGKVDIAPRNRYLDVPSAINKISMLFLTNVIGVKANGMKDKVEDNEKDWVLILTFLGLNKTDDSFTYLGLVLAYSIGNILAHSLYRGLFSVKPFFKIIKEGGNCELYFGVGNVSYVGGLFNLSLVCKPTLPTFLQDKVTIHIIDFKPFNFILGCVFSTWLMWYTECKKLYIRPQWILGFGTVEINIAKYYNISLNVGSWIVDWIMFRKYTKKDYKNEIKISELQEKN